MTDDETPHIEELIKALWHENKEVRMQATEALGTYGEAAVSPLLVALRKDDHNYDLQCYENADLRRAIIRVGEPAFQALIAALQPESDILRAASKMLELFDEPRAVEPMITAMLDNRVDSNGRCYIIDTLGRTRDLRAFEPLKTVLSDKDIYIRSHAARALAEYGNLSVISEIRKALRDQDSSWRYDREGLANVLKILQERSVGDDIGLRYDRYSPGDWRWEK
jgi:HEAT repeat protein